jgi:hypothetical protein
MPQPQIVNAPPTPAAAPVQYAPPLAPPPQPPREAPEGGNTGFTQGPGTAAQASVTVAAMPGPPDFSQQSPQSAPAPMPTGGTAAPTNFQIMAVKAAAALQQKDPMQLAAEILGPGVSGLQYVEQLTGEQAQNILAALRAVEVAGTFK